MGIIQTIKDPVTIITYHYVRDLSATRYPRINGLHTRSFEGQLDYVAKHYNVVGLGDVDRALNGGEPLPSRPCVLTFDDGLLDHYLTVFPLLEERGMIGSFFPIAQSVLEDRVLDVHKIHFILANMSDYKKLIAEIFEALRGFRKDYDLPCDDDLYLAYSYMPSRYDSPEVVFIKRILQKGLPENVRHKIVDRLYAEYVSDSDMVFSRELYMNIHQMRHMTRHGMEIGGHGYLHNWMELQSYDEQEHEIQKSLELLEKVYGRVPERWFYSYPYGSYNDASVELLKKYNCALAVTTRVTLANGSNCHILGRINTNDLPASADAAPSKWTLLLDM